MNFNNNLLKFKSYFILLFYSYLLDFLFLLLVLYLLISVFNICFYNVLLCDSITMDGNSLDGNGSTVSNTNLAGDSSMGGVETSPGFFLRYKLIIRRKLY